MSKRWFEPLGQHPATDRPIHGPRKHTVKEIAKGKAEANRAAKAVRFEEDMMQDPVATRERKNQTIKDAWQDQQRGFGSKKLTEEKLIKYFRQIVSVYEPLKNQKRASFLNYYYVLFKLLDLMNPTYLC